MLIRLYIIIDEACAFIRVFHYANGEGGGEGGEVVHRERERAVGEQADT